MNSDLEQRLSKLEKYIESLNDNNASKLKLLEERLDQLEKDVYEKPSYRFSYEKKPNTDLLEDRIEEIENDLYNENHWNGRKNCKLDLLEDRVKELEE